MADAPARVAPYFVVAAAIHVAAVISRFDRVASQLPDAAEAAILVAQFPLLVLSGFFEGGVDHGATVTGLPRWIQIRSRPIRWAFTFGFAYLAVVTAQTWHISLGAVSADPPHSFPPATRAMWFAMFTLGMSFPCYLAASAFLIPLLRWITAPLRMLRHELGLAGGFLGAGLALALGAVLGAAALALVTSTQLRDFVSHIQAAIAHDPTLAIAVLLATLLGPTALGLALTRRA